MVALPNSEFARFYNKETFSKGVLQPSLPFEHQEEPF